VTLKRKGLFDIHRFITCFVIAFTFFTTLASIRVNAFEVEPYFKTFHDFSDHVGHYGVGLNLATNGSTTGPYLRATGEVGNIFLKRMGLDYLLQGALGYTKQFGDVDPFAVSIYGTSGYQEVALYEGPRNAPEKAFYGGGVRYRQRVVELQLELHKFKDVAGIKPLVELIIPTGGTSESTGPIISMFYEKQFPGNNAVGFKVGYRF
jgi:hypothetical protein